MVFKFSKIKQDEELRMALSNFYKAFYGEDSINSESILTVDNYLEMLSARIEKILRNEKNCCQPVLVEEDGNRIICKLNNSFKKCNSGNSDRANTSIKNKGQKDIVDFFLKFNELYLQGFFGNDFLNSLDNLNNEYFKRLYDSNYNVSKEFDSELFELYSKIFINLRVDNVSSFNESEEENMNELKNLNELNLLECAHQIYKRDFKR